MRRHCQHGDTRSGRFRANGYSSCQEIPVPDLVFNIDTEFKRRAAISFHLNNHGVRTEPFESIEEFFSHAPKAGI